EAALSKCCKEIRHDQLPRRTRHSPCDRGCMGSRRRRYSQQLFRLYHPQHAREANQFGIYRNDQRRSTPAYEICQLSCEYSLFGDKLYSKRPSLLWKSSTKGGPNFLNWTVLWFFDGFHLLIKLWKMFFHTHGTERFGVDPSVEGGAGIDRLV